MKAVKLKLGAHMGNGLMYCVYQNQALYQDQGPITLSVASLDKFYNLPLTKNFITLFSRTVRVTKFSLIFFETRYTHGRWAHVLVYQNQDRVPMTLGV